MAPTTARTGFADGDFARLRADWRRRSDLPAPATTRHTHGVPRLSVSSALRCFAVSAILALPGCATLGTAREHRVPRWLPLASPTRASLRGVSVVSRDVVWVSGSDGTCLRSLDAGRSWLPCRVPGAPDRDFRDVQAFDANTAVLMAVGAPALIFRTDDGGATWRRTFEDARPAAFLDGLAFADDHTGWVFGDPVDGAFALLATADGGRTWQPSPAPPPLPGEAAFAASGTSLVPLPHGGVLIGTGGGPVARVLRKPNADAAFTFATTPLIAAAPSRGIFSLALHGADAIAVGGDYRAPESPHAAAAVSRDAGRTWRTPRHQGPRGYRSAVAFVADTLLALAVGETGADLTRDAGDTWEPAGDTGYHALAFAQSGTGYAVGSQGRIARIEWQ